MKRLTAWSLPALLLLIAVGCSKDGTNPIGPVAPNQQEKTIQTAPKSDWPPWPNPEWAKMPPYVKSYPAPTRKSALKKSATDEPPIVTNGDFETGDFSGWTMFVTYPGIMDRANGNAPHPEWAWFVATTDPRGSNTAIYGTMPHTDPMAHSGNFGASAVENLGNIDHQMYQDVTLPLGGNLTISFWLRWKNKYSFGPPNWFDGAQDIFVTLRNPATDAILDTVYMASIEQPPPFSGGGSIATANYEQRSADITAFAGQTVRLDFTTNAHSSILYVDFDDIAIVQVLTNQPPIAKVGLDQTVECTSHSGASVTLDGSGSSDPDHDVLTYSWAWTGGSASGVAPTVTLPLGSHEIILTVDDGKGGTAKDTVVVTAVDTTPPVINLNGPNDVTLECPATYTDPVTISDACDSSPSLATDGTVDGHTLGTYTLKYTATDASGNQSTATRTVHVVDTTPPVITLHGANPLLLECPNTYTEPGAAVTDACDPAPTLAVTGTVDGHTLGTYTVTYTAKDASGNQSTVVRTVNVVDTTPPTITLKGANPLVLECPGRYVERGATVKDACDPSPTLTIEGTVDGSTLGTYTVTYTATDHSGNTSTATRTVQVVDTKPPLLISFDATPMLWPPEHDLVNVGLKIKVKDACDRTPTITVKVYSDEDDVDADAGGDQSPDAANFGEGTLRLRAERNAKKNGRVYLIVVQATDHSGNSAYSYSCVVVPKAKNVLSIAAVTAQAIAVRLSARPDGSRFTPYLIGDGPIVGPKQ